MRCPTQLKVILVGLFLGTTAVLAVSGLHRAESPSSDCLTLNPSAPGELLMLGNSLLHDFDWPLANTRVLNCAKQGQTLGEFMMSRWQVVSRYTDNPDHIVIAFGTVEVVRSERDDRHIQEFMEVYPDFLDSLRQRWPDAQLVVNLLPPINGELFGRPQLDTAAVEQLNQFIRQSTNCSGCQVIDLPAVLAQGQVDFDETVTYDGVHLTGYGYEKWLRAVAHAIAVD